VQTAFSRNRFMVGIEISLSGEFERRTSRLNEDAQYVALTEHGIRRATVSGELNGQYCDQFTIDFFFARCTASAQVHHYHLHLSADCRLCDLAYVQPNKYRGTTVIAAAQTTPPEYLRSVAPPPLNIEDHLWTVREVLLSDPVLEEAATHSKQYQHIQGKLSPQQLEVLKAAIDIKVLSEHSFQLTYDTENRYDAMDVTNKLQTCLSRRHRRKGEQKTSEAATVIDEQLDALKKRIDTRAKRCTTTSKSPCMLCPIITTTTCGQSIRPGIRFVIAIPKSRKKKPRNLQFKRAAGSGSEGRVGSAIIHEKTADDTKLEDFALPIGAKRDTIYSRTSDCHWPEAPDGDLEKTIASQPKKGRSEPSPTYLRYSQLKSELEGVDQRIQAYKREQTSLGRISTNTRIYWNPLLNTRRVIEDIDRELKVGDMQFHAFARQAARHPN